MRGMAEVVLFHSVLGLRPAVLAAADRLRASGHEVHTPDLYGDGRTFEAIEAGMPAAELIGFDGLRQRAEAAVVDLPANVVYGGWSWGAGAAQHLAMTRPGARGALLLHDAADPQWFGAPWPASVPLQVHHAADDPWVEADQLAALLLAVRAAGADVEVFSYPGDGHLFDDSALEAYDPASTELLWQRATAFLDSLSDGTSADRRH